MGMWCIDKGIWLSVIVLAVLSQVYCQTALKEINGTFTMITLEWNETYIDTESHQYIDFVNTTRDQIENIFRKDQQGDTVVLKITFSNLREPNVTADVNIKLNTTLSNKQIEVIFGNWTHLHSYENEPFTVTDISGDSSTTPPSNVESSVQDIQSSETIETHVTVGLVTSNAEDKSSSTTEENHVSQSHAPNELQSSSIVINEVHVTTTTEENNVLSTPVLIQPSTHILSTPGVERLTSSTENHIFITTSSSRISESFAISSDQAGTQPSSQQLVMQTSFETGTHSSLLISEAPSVEAYSSSHIATELASAGHTEQNPDVVTSVNQVLTTSSMMRHMQYSSSYPNDHQISVSLSMVDKKDSAAAKEILPQSSSVEQAIETSTRVAENIVNTSYMDVNPSSTTSLVMVTETLRYVQESSSISIRTERVSSKEILSVKSSSIDTSSRDVPSRIASSSIEDVVLSEAIDQNPKTSITHDSNLIDTFTSSAHDQTMGTRSDLQASSSHIPAPVYESDIHVISSKSDLSLVDDLSSSSIDNFIIGSSTTIESTETQGTEISISSSVNSIVLPIVHDSPSSKFIDASKSSTPTLPHISSTTVMVSVPETSLGMPTESSTEVSSRVMTDEENTSTAILESDVSPSSKLSMDQSVQKTSSTTMLLESDILQTTSSWMADISRTVSSLYESATHEQSTAHQMKSNSEIIAEIPSVSSASHVISPHRDVWASVLSETMSPSMYQTSILSSTPSSESSASSDDMMAQMSTPSYDIQSSLVHIPVESEQVSNQLSPSSLSQTSLMDHSSQSVHFVPTPSLDVMQSFTEEVSSKGGEVTSTKSEMEMSLSQPMQTSAYYMTEQPIVGSGEESISSYMIVGNTQSQMEPSEVYSSYSPQSQSVSSEGVSSTLAIDGVVSASFGDSVTSMTPSEAFPKSSAAHNMTSSKSDLSLESSEMFHMSSKMLESTHESMFMSLSSSLGESMPPQTRVTEIITSQQTETMSSIMDIMTESVHTSIASSMIEGSSSILHVSSVSSMSPSTDVLSSVPVFSVVHESSETELKTDLMSSEASYSGISSYIVESSSSVVIPLPELSQTSPDTMSTMIFTSSQDLEMTTADFMTSEIGSSSLSIPFPIDTPVDISSSSVEVGASSSPLSEQIPPIDESIVFTVSSIPPSTSVMITTETMLTESSYTTMTASSELISSSQVSLLPTMSSPYTMAVSSGIPTFSVDIMSSSPHMIPTSSLVSTSSMELSSADALSELSSTLSTSQVSFIPTMSSPYTMAVSSGIPTFSVDIMSSSPHMVPTSSLVSTSSMKLSSADASSELSSTLTDVLTEMPTSTYKELSTSVPVSTSLELSTDMSPMDSSSDVMTPIESSSSVMSLSEVISSSSMLSAEISFITSSILSSSMDTSSFVLLPTSTETLQSSSVSSSGMDISSSFILLTTSSEIASSPISTLYLSSSSISTMMTSAPEMVASSSIMQPGSSSIASSSLLDVDSSLLMPTSLYQSSSFMMTTSSVMSSPEMSSESITSLSSIPPSSSAGLPTLSSVLTSSEIESYTLSVPSSQITSSTLVMPASSSSMVVVTTSESSPVVTLPVKEQLQGQFRITNGTIWTESLKDKNSQEYKTLATDLQTLLTQLFNQSSLKSSFLKIGNDMTFSKGSVIVDYTVIFQSAVPAENVTEAFKESVAESNNLLGSYPIDVTSVVHGDELSQTTSPPPLTTETAETTSRAQLLPHWAIAVLVCGGVLLVFLLFMMFVLCSRRHTRQKYRMPEDPDDIGYRRSWASSNSGSGEFAYENKLEISDSLDNRKLPFAESSEIALNDSSPRHKSNDPKTNGSIMEDRENGRHKPRIINGKTTLYDIEQDSWETHL